MDGWRRIDRVERKGLAMCVLLLGTFAAWMAGWAWFVAPATLGVLGLAAAVAGADTRAAGDWRRVEPE